MLVLLLDAVVIMALIYIVNQGEQMNFGPAILAALAIGLGTFACTYVLAPSIGLFSLLPILIIAVLVIWIVSGLPLERAAIAGGIFTVYKIAISLLFVSMLR
jgi:hypothetical protein